jgi:hypothetical protein
MKNISIIPALCSLFLLAAALPLPAGGGREAPRTEVLSGPGLYEKAGNGALVEITGRIRLVGSEPFPELVISDDENHDWYIPGPESKTIRALDQQRVTLRGKLSLQEMILANGRKLEDRRNLSEVEIVQ